MTPPGVSYLQGQVFIAPHKSLVPGLYTQVGPEGMAFGPQKMEIKVVDCSFHFL